MGHRVDVGIPQQRVAHVERHLHLADVVERVAARLEGAAGFVGQPIRRQPEGWGLEAEHRHPLVEIEPPREDGQIGRRRSPFHHLDRLRPLHRRQGCKGHLRGGPPRGPGNPRQRPHPTLQFRRPVEDRIAAEEFVGTEARERHGDPAIPRRPAHDERVQPVDARPVGRPHPLRELAHGPFVVDDRLEVSRPEHVRRLGRGRRLVGLPLHLESDAEGLHRAMLGLGEGRDRGAVDAGREKHPQRHVGHTLPLDRAGQQVERGRGGRGGRGPRRIDPRETPVAAAGRPPAPELVEADPLERSRRQRTHVPVHRERILRRPVGEEGGDARRVELGRHEPRGEHRPHLAGKHDGVAHPGHVERLDAQRPAGQEHPPRGGVVEGEGKHPVEFVEGCLAPLGEGVEQDLRVARGVERVPLRQQPGPQVGVVVDLAVEDDHIARGGIHHRLMTGRREVEDRQPPEAEGRDRAGRVVRERHLGEAIVVRAAMHHCPRHPLGGGAALLGRKPDHPADAAHDDA